MSRSITVGSMYPKHQRKFPSQRSRHRPERKSKRSPRIESRLEINYSSKYHLSQAREPVDQLKSPAPTRIILSFIYIGLMERGIYRSTHFMRGATGSPANNFSNCSIAFLFFI